MQAHKPKCDLNQCIAVIARSGEPKENAHAKVDVRPAISPSQITDYP